MVDVFFLSEIFYHMSELWHVFLEEPKIYFSIIGEWVLVQLYFLISQDKENLADVYAAGVTLGFIGFELLPFRAFTLSDTTVLVATGLMLYGLFIIILAMIKAIPTFLVRFLGMPSVITLPTLFIILYFETTIPMDWVTIGILGIPVVVMEVVTFLRQYTPL